MIKVAGPGSSTSDSFLRRARLPLALSAGGAATLYLGAAFASDGGQVVASLRDLGPNVWLLALALPLLNYMLRFARWHGYLSALGNRVPVIYDLRVYIAGFALTTTPGKVGETVRSVLLRTHGVSYSDSMAAFVAERFTDLIAVALLALLASIRFAGPRWFVVASVLSLTIALFLVNSPLLERWMQRRAEGRGRLGRSLARGLRGARACRALLSSHMLAGGLALALLAWTAEGTAFFVIVRELGYPVGMATSIGVYAVGTLAGALSFVPGGLGPMEGIITVLLVLQGVSVPDAVAATVAVRVVTLWLAVALGVLAMLSLGVTPDVDAGVGAEE